MVDIIFVPCKFKEKVFLDKDSLKVLKEKNIRSLFIFSSAQFDTIEIENQLKKEGIKTKKILSKRSSEKGQLLGCDCYEDSFSKNLFDDNKTGVLYVGDGFFHPLSLLLAQKEDFKKEIFVFNPLRKELKIFGRKEVNQIIKKLKRNLLLFLNSKKIGIIVSTKFGQQYLDLCLRLKKNLERKGKDIFVFVCDFFDLRELENFPFIDCWVNSACPRIGFDDALLTERPLINIKDAFRAEKVLDKISNYSNE